MNAGEHRLRCWGAECRVGQVGLEQVSPHLGTSPLSIRSKDWFRLRVPLASKRLVEGGADIDVAA